MGQHLRGHVNDFVETNVVLVNDLPHYWYRHKLYALGSTTPNRWWVHPETGILHRVPYEESYKRRSAREAKERARSGQRDGDWWVWKDGDRWVRSRLKRIPDDMPRSLFGTWRRDHYLDLPVDNSFLWAVRYYYPKDMLAERLYAGTKPDFVPKKQQKALGLK